MDLRLVSTPRPTLLRGLEGTRSLRGPGELGLQCSPSLARGDAHWARVGLGHIGACVRGPFWEVLSDLPTRPSLKLHSQGGSRAREASGAGSDWAGPSHAGTWVWSDWAAGGPAWAVGRGQPAGRVRLGGGRDWLLPSPLPCRASREHPSVQEKKKSTIWQL